MEKKVIFYDNNGSMCYAIIDISDTVIIIKGYDEVGRETSFLKLLLKENIWYIDYLVCFEQYRNKGIATALLNMVDYILKDYNGFIYGKYSPCDDSIPDEKLNEITNSFYVKNGYTVISKKDFLENISNYPELSEKDFEKTKEKFGHSIIFKRNIKKQNYRFIEKDNILMEIENWRNDIDFGINQSI